MEFHDAANFLLARRRAPELGSGRTAALLADLDDPQSAFPVVLVAGSNGKGSTARMVERVLREAGHDVGLFSSPHLEDFRESVRVNGRKVTKATVADFVAAARPVVADWPGDGAGPTYFELLTALACRTFAEQGVDVAVFETGMGGVRDATGALDADAAAVTAVARDHESFLGDADDIARELAAIAPDERPLVTAATGEALATVRETAGDVLTVGGEAAGVTATYDGIEGIESVVALDGDDWRVETRLALLGAHQARNAGVAAALCRQVADVSTDALATGLRNAHWPGRFEVMGQQPLVVLDGAHNPAACEAVTETLAAFDYDDLHLVAGAMADKDLDGIAAALPDPDRAITCEADLDRAVAAGALADAFERVSPAAEVTAASNVAEAVADAMDAVGPDDCLLVSGSLAVVAQARRRWTRAMIPKSVDDRETARAMLADADVPAATVLRTSGDAVHRIRKTRIQPRQARYLREELLSLGGECAISGLDEQDEEPLAVVMLATQAQFERLADALDGQPYGLDPFADELRESLSLGTDADADSGAASGERAYPWIDGTAVMGILNATPDSFHDGGEYDAVADAISRAHEMIDNGADIVDIGGESTRPGADPVPVEEEIERVVPVVERLADADALLSVDTRKAAVARAALDAGADVLNDVSGLKDPEMRLVAAEYDVPVVVMHSIDTPVVPGNAVDYDDVVEDVIDQLVERVLLAEKAGLDREQIVVDPGLGFGKTPAESFELLGRIEEFAALGCPVLVGHSHKSMFSHVGKEAGERLDATVAATAVAAEHGADIVRVHDVEGNAAAVDVVAAAADPHGFEP